MAKYSFDIWYFLGKDKDGNPNGNVMTTQQRVENALLLLQSETDYIELTLSDNCTKTKCSSAEDIMKVVAEYYSEQTKEDK